MPVLSATLAEIEEAFAHPGGLHIEDKSLVGEESLTGFDPLVWKRCQVGDVLEGRYKVLGKVANGGSSTIWFVEEEEIKVNWVLKISIKYTSGDARETRAFEIVGGRAITTKHLGLRCLQQPARRFTINSDRSGRHQCFLMEPSACHVEDAWRVLGDFPLALTKETLENTLKALDFLHTECRLIHTDLKLDNILFDFKDKRIVDEYVEELRRNPAPVKIHHGKNGDQYPVTAAKPFILKKDSFANPKLTDLGESVELPVDNDGFAAPRVCSPKAFRAPETLLGRPFNEKIDCWMMGCVTLQLVTGKVPILPHGPNQPWLDVYTLAQQHALLGPPPKSFLAQSENSREFWNEDGEWIHPQHAVPDISLESMLTIVKDRKQRERALDFVRSCLQWLPEDRLCASELAKHAFLVRGRKECVRASLEERIVRLRAWLGHFMRRKRKR